MRFEITEIEDLSGKEAHIYSVTMDGDDNTLLEQFFEDNQEYEKELAGILKKIKVMANNTGCRKQYFEEGEGALADGVVALKSGRLRLYGIYFNNTVVLFGSGGWKPEGVRAYQEFPELDEKAQQVRQIAEQINKAIRDRDIKIEKDGVINDENWENYYD